MSRLFVIITFKRIILKYDLSSELSLRNNYHTPYHSVGEDEPLTGSWSEDGCSLMEQEGEAVVCECNHLTHFAILLSPGAEVHTPTHTHAHAHTHIHTQTHTHAHIHTNTNTHAHMHVGTHIHT